MHPFIFVLLFCSTSWFTFWLFTKILEAIQPDIRHRLKEDYQLEYSPWSIQWTTRTLNQTFNRMASAYPRLFSTSFSLGVICGGFMSVASVGILLYNLACLFLRLWERVNGLPRDIAHPTKTAPILTPLIPGVTVPIEEVFFLFVALFLAGIFHELGHAVAAACESRRIRHFGIFIMGIYPGAFVDIRDDITFLSPFRQLKIFCAGAWHNLIGALFCLVLALSIPFVLGPFYTTVNGVMVAEVSSDHALNGHLPVNSIITALNSCPVTGIESWGRCLENLSSASSILLPFPLSHIPSSHPPGYCLSSKKIDDLIGNSATTCCDSFTVGDSNDHCFQVLSVSKNICAIARPIASGVFCRSDANCSPDEKCVMPMSPEPSSTLIKIQLTNATFLLFSGSVYSLYRAVEVVSEQPLFAFFPLKLPLFLYSFLKYLISISIGLGAINMAPVYYLDGQYAFSAFLSLCLPSSPIMSASVSSLVFTFTSVVLFLNILLSLILL